MKLKVIFTLLLFVSVLSVNAQRANLIKGNWKYQDVTEKEKLDSTSLKMLEMFFSEVTFDIKENGQYKAQFMGKSEEGAWKLNKDESKITFTSSKGPVNEMTIVEVSQNKLVLNFGKPNSLILKKAEPAKEGK